jgi:hypothetical protein
VASGDGKGDDRDGRRGGDWGGDQLHLLSREYKNGSWKLLFSSNQAYGMQAFVCWYSSRSLESFRVGKGDWTLYLIKIHSAMSSLIPPSSTAIIQTTGFVSLESSQLFTMNVKLRGFTDDTFRCINRKFTDNIQHHTSHSFLNAHRSMDRCCAQKRLAANLKDGDNMR